MSRRLVAVTLTIALFGACGDEHEVCVLGDPNECDVREAECIERLNALVVCMRGVEHPVPDYVVLTPEEELAALPEPVVPDADEAARAALYYDGLKLLRLLPQDWAPSYEKPTSVQEPFIRVQEDGSLRIVVDRSLPENEVRALLYALTFAHRSVEVDIEALFDVATFDQGHALGSLLAGESFFYANLGFEWSGGDPAVAEEFDFRGSVDFARGWLADESVTFWDAMSIFDAYFGTYQAHQDFIRGGQAAIDAAYEEQLGSTAHTLAGPHIEIEAAFSAVDTELPVLPDGFEYLFQNQFGPTVYHMHQLRMTGAFSRPDTEEAIARTWVGDRILFTGNLASEQVAVVWQIAGSDGTVAETIIAASDAKTETSFRALFP